MQLTKLFQDETRHLTMIKVRYFWPIYGEHDQECERGPGSGPTAFDAAASEYNGVWARTLGGYRLLMKYRMLKITVRQAGQNTLNIQIEFIQRCPAFTA